MKDLQLAQGIIRKPSGFDEATVLQAARVVATALEKADARIVELEAEVTTLKTKPLHYDYETVVGMQNKWFNELAALAAIVKQQRDALIGVLSLDEEHQRGADDIDVCYEVRRGREALALDTTTAENVLAEYRREVVEECAEVCDDLASEDYCIDVRVAADAIRALIAAPAQGESKEGK